jgi:hypothetical protein
LTNRVKSLNPNFVRSSPDKSADAIAAVAVTRAGDNDPQQKRTALNGPSLD